MSSNKERNPLRANGGARIANSGCYILAVDAKDLWIANHFKNPSPVGYNPRRRDGELNLGKFIASFDNSLERIKLAEVYEKVYRKTNFSFTQNKKEYTKYVINVTFKYSLKEYNRFYGDIYVKYGYSPNEVNLVDNVDVRDGELVAVRVDHAVENPVGQDVLGEFFAYDAYGGCYEVGSIPLVMNVAQLRTELYKNGFVCDGIKYVRYKRSTGSSRIGNCLFIDENLYSRIFKWSKCGVRVRPGQEIDLAAFEAAISLTLSNIIDVVEIHPENILVIDDYDSEFFDTVAATTLGKNGCLETSVEEVKVKNSIWDGQSLIDKSAMGSYQDKGFILLRNRFFKSACFNCNLQDWFRDNGITEVSQLNGYTLAEDIASIKLVTTPSSIKYVKFGTLDDWLRRVEPMFGVVKHEKPTHFFGGRFVQTHYQLLNSMRLSQEDVDELLSDSLEYVSALRTNPSVLRYHIQYTGADADAPAQTKNDIVYRMLGVNDKFAKTKLFYDFVKDISDAYIKNLRCGHVLVPGTYATMVGNPIEMLRSAIGKFDGTSQVGVGNVCSVRFADGEQLLGSRSPHVTMGNVWVTTNTANADVLKYLNMTNEIVCVNTIGENVMNRLSGCDFDSDTVLLTNQHLLLKRGIECQQFYVPTHMVPATKRKRHYEIDDQADLDIATSVNKIGEIVNLSQELNTLIWDKLNRGETFEDILPIYLDTAKLDVLSNIEIDKAKREYAVDSTFEIKKIKNKYGMEDGSGRQIKPNFFGAIARTKGYYDSNRKNYKFHQTTMDYLQRSINRRKRTYTKHEFEPFSSIIDTTGYKRTYVKKQQIDKILGMARECNARVKAIWSNNSDLDTYTKSALAAEEKDALAGYIKTMKMSKSTIVKLLDTLDREENSDIGRMLFYMLFSAPSEAFYAALKESETQLPLIVEQPDGEMFLYGLPFGVRFATEDIN